jgi:actin related protein 2/3 complex subunit 2
MILLDYNNKIIEDTLLEKFKPPEDGKYESVETVLADFDGVTFHLWTDQNAKNILNISMSIKCYNELKKYGVQDIMKKNYDKFITNTENGYDITLQVDLSKPPSDPAKVAHDISLLKRHAFSAPFYKVFSDIEAKKGGQLVEIKYRDDEAFYLKPESDRCIVIFSIQFKDPDDVVFAKVFLQEYQDARRTMSNAPSVTYSQKEPPLELQGVRNLRVGDSNGFVSFVLFAPHISSGKRDKTIDNIQTFRNYLHYHIKCSKAYMHTRMRNKVRTFLQVLNRAKSEPQSTEKKTITGRTFRRADEPEKDDEEFNI